MLIMCRTLNGDLHFEIESDITGAALRDILAKLLSDTIGIPHIIERNDIRVIRNVDVKDTDMLVVTEHPGVKVPRPYLQFKDTGECQHLSGAGLFTIISNEAKRHFFSDALRAKTLLEHPEYSETNQDLSIAAERHAERLRLSTVSIRESDVRGADASSDALPTIPTSLVLPSPVLVGLLPDAFFGTSNDRNDVVSREEKSDKIHSATM